MTQQIAYRRSRQRAQILELLRSTTSHPTAQEIYDRLRNEFPHLSLGTVYRNLNILVEQGEIKRLQYGSTFDRYDGSTNPHYHFICTVCNRVYDMPIQPFSKLEAIADKQSEHSVHAHSIDFYGICENCRKQRENSKYAISAS